MRYVLNTRSLNFLHCPLQLTCQWWWQNSHLPSLSHRLLHLFAFSWPPSLVPAFPAAVLASIKQCFLLSFFTVSGLWGGDASPPIWALSSQGLFCFFSGSFEPPWPRATASSFFWRTWRWCEGVFRAFHFNDFGIYKHERLSCGLGISKSIDRQSLRKKNWWRSIFSTSTLYKPFSPLLWCSG